MHLSPTILSHPQAHTLHIYDALMMARSDFSRRFPNFRPVPLRRPAHTAALAPTSAPPVPAAIPTPASPDAATPAAAVAAYSSAAAGKHHSAAAAAAAAAAWSPAEKTSHGQQAHPPAVPAAANRAPITELSPNHQPPSPHSEPRSHAPRPMHRANSCAAPFIPAPYHPLPPPALEHITAGHAPAAQPTLPHAPHMLPSHLPASPQGRAAGHEHQRLQLSHCALHSQPQQPQPLSQRRRRLQQRQELQQEALHSPQQPVLLTQGLLKLDGALGLQASLPAWHEARASQGSNRPPMGHGHLRDARLPTHAGEPPVLSAPATAAAAAVAAHVPSTRSTSPRHHARSSSSTSTSTTAQASAGRIVSVATCASPPLPPPPQQQQQQQQQEVALSHTNPHSRTHVHPSPRHQVYLPHSQPAGAPSAPPIACSAPPAFQAPLNAMTPGAAGPQAPAGTLHHREAREQARQWDLHHLQPALGLGAAATHVSAGAQPRPGRGMHDGHARWRVVPGPDSSRCDSGGQGGMDGAEDGTGSAGGGPGEGPGDCGGSAEGGSGSKKTDARTPNRRHRKAGVDVLGAHHPPALPLAAAPR